MRILSFAAPASFLFPADRLKQRFCSPLFFPLILSLFVLDFLFQSCLSLGQIVV